MACYTVGEDLPAELKDDECIEDAETSRDHGEKNAGTITGKLRTKANQREAHAELSALAHGPDQPRRSMR